ncbi:MAG: VOC family protein [Dehalococcoidia bacterium]|nr:VOC family protein [Dehalococcoidia bacterium]
MQASNVSHIGICVRDMDKSLAFYRDALGMRVLGDKPTDPAEGGRYDNYKHRRTARRWVSLAYGAGTSPTLTLTSHPGERPDGQSILLDQVGITHFSFTVPNVQALAGELMAKGVKLTGTLDSFRNSKGELRSIYVRDPDGILLQFNSPGAGA